MAFTIVSLTDRLTIYVHSKPIGLALASRLDTPMPVFCDVYCILGVVNQRSFEAELPRSDPCVCCSPARSSRTNDRTSLGRSIIRIKWANVCHQQGLNPQDSQY